MYEASAELSNHATICFVKFTRFRRLLSPVPIGASKIVEVPIAAG